MRLARGPSRIELIDFLVNKMKLTMSCDEDPTFAPQRGLRPLRWRRAQGVMPGLEAKIRWLESRLLQVCLRKAKCS